MENKPDKGQENGSCNITTCQQPGAVYFNHSTRSYYCKGCAQRLNVHNKADALRMFGHDLCTQPFEDKYLDSDVWWTKQSFEYKGFLIIEHLGPQFIDYPGINNLSQEQIFTIYTKK